MAYGKSPVRKSALLEGCAVCIAIAREGGLLVGVGWVPAVIYTLVKGVTSGSLGQAYLACCYLPLLLLLQGLVLRHLCRVDLHVGHHRHASLHVAIHLLRHHLSLLLLLECLEALLLHLLLSDCI